MVREVVSNIIRGKALIGYHLPQKMSDFGLLTTDKESSGGHLWDKAFDIAKIFNATDSSQQ